MKPQTTSSSTVPSARAQPSIAEWKVLVAKYQNPSVTRATWQIVDTLVPYTLLWALMFWTVAISWWLTIPLAMLAGGQLDHFLARKCAVRRQMSPIFLRTYATHFSTRRPPTPWHAACKDKPN
ncbi:MAG: hypothetical protein U0984_06020 [Prosthecobacter sp.]|nr:hypothetical protein [Prosthecobacter sp.]